MTLEKLKELRDDVVGMSGVDGLLEEDVLETMDELIAIKEARRSALEELARLDADML